MRHRALPALLALLVLGLSGCVPPQMSIGGGGGGTGFVPSGDEDDRDGGSGYSPGDF